jgi:hypothetical protein
MNAKMKVVPICGTDLHIIKAYDTFENAANEKALRVILTN